MSVERSRTTGRRVARGGGLLALALAASWSPAGVPGAAAQDWMSWTAYWENDSFVKRSRDVSTGDDAYTNGVRFVVSRNPVRNRGWWEWVDSLGARWARSRLTRDRFDDSDSPTASIVVGQNFFTPNVITDYEVEQEDRPFAGMLYAGLRLDLTEDEQELGGGLRTRFQHSVEADVGVIGPAGQARRVQSGVHALRSSRIPKGWHHEIGNEPVLQLNYMSRARVGWRFLDVTPHAGVLLGNPQTGVYGGATARVGYGLSDFPALVLPMSVIGESGRGAFEIALIAGFEGRAFLRQRFVPTNFAGDTLRIGKEPLVYDWRLGGTVRIKDWRFSYTYLDRSEEITGPFGVDHDFGSIAFGYEPDREARPDETGSWFVPNFHFEAGLGDGTSHVPGGERVEGVGMHVALGVGLPRLGRVLPRNRVILGVEVAGMGREGPRPPDGEPHTDEFLLNLLGTVRWRPFGRGPGLGILEVRGGIGAGHLARQVVQPMAGTVTTCPPGTAPEQETPPRFCEASETGRAMLLGLAYTVPVGNQLSAGIDLSWNWTEIDAGRTSFRMPGFTLKYHPSG